MNGAPGLGGGPVALLGGSGLLGRALERCLGQRGLRVVSPGRRDCDLSRPQTVAPVLESIRPCAVIDAAAFADVRAAEDPSLRREVFAVNRDGPAAAAGFCARHAIPFVYVSTDYVFDGRKGRPYVEDDPVAPLQVYGRSKLEGERAVTRAHPHALVVRTSGLFGPEPKRPSYVDAILAQARCKPVLEVVETPVSSPTFSPDLAAGILQLVHLGVRGIVHLTNAGHCSRLELARKTVELAGLGSRVRRREEPADALERPAYSVLDTRRFVSWTGSPLRHWRDALAEYVGRPGQARLGQG